MPLARYLPFLFVCPAFGQYLTPHAGWKLAPGGENLIQLGYWNTKYIAYGEYPTVANGVLSVPGASGYLGGLNPIAPHLLPAGDWGVIASFNVAPGQSGSVELYGSLNTGAQSWQGTTELVFGLD